MPGGVSKGKSATVHNTENDGDAVTFGYVDFTEDDLGNAPVQSDGTRQVTYEYDVTQTGNVPGVKLDSNATRHVKLTVTDDGQGNITVASNGGDVSDLTWNNVYDPSPVALSGDTALHGTKRLVGRAMKPGEQFYFTLVPTGTTLTNSILDGSVDMETGIMFATAAGGADGQDVPFSFDGITFNRPGTYTFSIYEEQPANSSGNGVEYAAVRRAVTVNVTEARDVDGLLTGALEADVTYDNSRSKFTELRPITNRAAFENVYRAADATLAVAGTKTLDVASGLTAPDIAGKFTFTLKGVDGAPVHASGAQDGMVTTTNTANGDVTFPELTFSTDDLADVTPDATTGVRSKTFTYRVTENTCLEKVIF